MEIQMSFAKEPGLVADGRDMGTVVFPNAKFKVFLDASAEERANRRVKQLQSKGEDAIISRIVADIEERDHRDRSRKVSPLRPAEDAVVIDTSFMSIEEVLLQVEKLVEN
jgi:cytidylate kinase